MKWEQLEHVLRASAAIAQETSFVVVGSQAVLLSHPNAPADFEKRLHGLDDKRYPLNTLNVWVRRRAQEAAA